MAHTSKEKTKLLHRVHRAAGQLKAVEKAIEKDADCSELLHNIAVCRGALDSLMAKVIDYHLRENVLGAEKPGSAGQLKAAEDLIDGLRAYLK